MTRTKISKIESIIDNTLTIGSVLIGAASMILPTIAIIIDPTNTRDYLKYLVIGVGITALSGAGLAKKFYTSKKQKNYDNRRYSINI